MEINKQMLNTLLSYNDDTLRSKLVEISEYVGISRDDAVKLTADIPRVRAMLAMVSDDDVRDFLTKFRK